MAPGPALPAELADAYEEAQTLARRHYENFPVASLLLEKRLRPHVSALYAFARTADDFADEDAPGRTPAERLRDLGEWERGLRAALRGRPAPRVLPAFAHTMRTFDIPLTLPLALLKAFRMDVTVKRWPTWERLLFYCRHSADPVGRMVLLIHGVREGRLHALSDRICSGLQLVNFWQDSSIDLSRGRIYYPRSEWGKAGVTERALLERRVPPEAADRLVSSAVRHTALLFEEGRPLLAAVRGRLRFELKATLLGGLGLLDKVRRLGGGVLSRRPSWSPLEKAILLAKGLLP
jgi:squalene synthase HpnC